MPTLTIYSNDGVLAATVERGTALQHLGPQHGTPIIFGCRKGKCGACMIRVLNGSENLSQLGARERAVLDILTSESDRRLACQCTVHGDVALEIAD